MSLKNLAQRYEEKVNQLYAGATLKFENGKPSRGFNDDPLNVRRVGDESFGNVSRALGRFLPVVRAGQDTLRLTKFLASVRGLTFLAKQQLLQTGNTFELTRLLNPVFVLGAAASPAVGNIVRMRRHLNPFNNLLAKTDTGRNTVKTLGQLQKSTYDKNFLIQTTSKKLTWTDFKPGQVRNTIQNIGAQSGMTWEKSRPELKVYIDTINNSNITIPFLHGGVVTKLNKYGTVSETGTNAATKLVKYSSRDWFATVPADYRIESPTRPFLNSTSNPFTVRTEELSDVAKANALSTSTPFISKSLNTQINSSLQARRDEVAPDSSSKLEKLFTSGGPAFSPALNLDIQQSSYQTKYEAINPVGYIAYFSGSSGNSIRGKLRLDNTNAQDIAANASSPVSYLRDESNDINTTPTSNVLSKYGSIPTKFTDPIVVSFAMGNNTPIPFRAFIKDLNHSINPEYKTNQYIGRIEKFISYVSVQRELSFKLGVIAFSKDELKTVWNRINYLTGMAFPYGISRGILQPNIVRLTIGKLFIDQPGYVTAISTNFNDISESWDIDQSVPIGATVDIKFSIIEKSTAVADSPFYGINE